MKSKKLIQFESDFQAIDKIKIFEVPVIDKRTNKQDYIVFDIMIRGNSFVAQHIGLSAKQEKSKKIAFTAVKIDLDNSMDENLQELYSACIESICESEFFELSE